MASWQSDESDTVDNSSTNYAIEQLFMPLSPSSSEDDKRLPLRSEFPELVGPKSMVHSNEIFYRSSEDCGMVSSIDIFAIALGAGQHNYCPDDGTSLPQYRPMNEKTDDTDDSVSLRSSSLSSTESDLSQADPADNDVGAESFPEHYGLRRRSERHIKRKRTNYAELDTISDDPETRKQNKKRKQNQASSRVHSPTSASDMPQPAPTEPLFVWESQCHQNMLGTTQQQQQQVTYHTFVLESGAHRLRNGSL